MRFAAHSAAEVERLLPSCLLQISSRNQPSEFLILVNLAPAFLA